MTYVVGEPCIDVLDRSCVDECPVDCIYEGGAGGRALWIAPDECVDCAACVPVCPVDAIWHEDETGLGGPVSAPPGLWPDTGSGSRAVLEESS